MLEKELRSIKQENSDKIDEMNNKFTADIKSVYELL
jgi:hypothetical protein